MQADALLDALRHALGANWVRIVRRGAQVYADAPRGWRKRQSHSLTVDVPGSDPPTQLVCSMSRAPSVADTLLAGAVARSLVAERRTRSGAGGVAGVIAALTRPDPQEALDMAVEITGAKGGAFLSDGRVVTAGAGRPALRRAAMDAAAGTDGVRTIEDRTFLQVPLGAGAGLALENVADGPDARAVAALLGGMRAPAPSPAPVADMADLRAFVTAFPTPALAVDAQGKLAAASPEAEHLLGLTADFDVGLPLSGKLSSPALEDAAAGRAPPVPVVVSGVRFDVAVIDLPSGGRALLLIDRSREDTLERVQEDLVSGVAHELRTPVAALQALIQLLRLRGGKLDEERLGLLLDDGEREVVRLRTLVEDLLLAARIATGGILPVASTIDLTPIARSVADELGDRYRDRTFEVTGESSAHADPALIRHAVWHLADNAAKFSPAGSVVRIEIAADSSINVTDQGEGIFSGDIPRLFQRFGQLDGTSTRAHAGAGLGLFIVKSVVEAQDGSVVVQSRLGQGSTFSIRLPGPRD